MSPPTLSTPVHPATFTPTPATTVAVPPFTLSTTTHTTTTSTHNPPPAPLSPPVGSTPSDINSFGDPIHSTQDFRYIFQNINGKFQSKADKLSVLASLTTLEPDVLGLTEPNIQWHPPQYNQIREATHQIWPHSRHVQGNCPPDAHFPSTLSKQQGGIFQLAHGSHSGRIFSHSVDFLGRWATQVFRLKQGRSLAVISAYRPGHEILSAATEGTVIKQQFRELRRRGMPEPDPRTLFFQDLARHILSLQSGGHAILLGIDANPSTSDTDLANFLTRTTLFDLLSTKFPNPPATHSRGRRLDFIFGCSFALQQFTSAGIISTDYGATSDHAAIYVDISATIFSKKAPDPTAPSTRGFWLHDKPKVLRFCSAVNDHLENNTLLTTCLDQLDSVSSDGEVSTIARLCNDIDDILTETTLTAEKSLRRKGMNLIPWSLKYHQAKKLVIHWNRSRRSILRSGTMPLIPSQVTTTPADALAYVNSQLRSAWSALKAIKRHAFRHRSEFLYERIKAHTEAGNTNKATRVRQILNNETRRRTYQKLSRLVKGTAPSGISKVLSPTAEGVVQEVTDVEDLFATLLTRNTRHFEQAKETPFATQHADTIPPFEPHPSHESILQGRPPFFSDLPPEMNAFLSHLKTQIPESFQVEIDTAHFIDGMKKIGEGKSSSLSGRHYGIYKALLGSPIFCETVVRLINLSVRHCFLLRRWKKVIQVMLCKQPGNFNVNKLRVIQLLEADLNMYLRLIWGKRLVHHILQHGGLPNEQFGSRPGTQATSAALLKVLSFDLVRLTRCEGTVLNNDATACYDRILPAISQLCCRRLGLPVSAAKFMLEFLRSAEYHVKTQHGVSKECYGNHNSRVFGVLQGSGSAPAIWLAVSVVLIDTYNFLFPSDGIPDPRRLHYLVKIIDAFVDDTDLWDVLLRSNLDSPTLIQRMTHRAQAWERLMFASGGKLNLQKCFWYLITWQWNDGIPRLSTLQETPGELTIHSSADDQPLTITRVDTTDALATLGIWTSPSGQNESQVNHLKTVLAPIMNTIRQAPLSTAESAFLLPVYLLPKLRYVLAGTTLTKKQCKLLDNKFLPTLKSKMGYNRNTALPVIHGSHHYGGAQIPTCWEVQGSVHIELLLGHLQLQDLVCHYLTHGMDYLYLHIGLARKLLSYPITPAILALDSPTWLTNTWEYMTDISATLVTDSLEISQQRELDVPIMQEALASFSGITLRRINAVRLFLQVFFLSDVVTSDGREIDRAYCDSSLTPSRTSLLEWPDQAPPGKLAWSEWRRMLRTCYTTRNFTLRIPLGRWLSPSLRTQSWFTLINPDNNQMYYKIGPVWHRYYPNTRARSLYHFQEETPFCPAVPLLPVTILRVREQVYRLTPFAPRLPSPSTLAPSMLPFLQSLKRLPPHEKSTIGHIMPLTPADATNLLHTIRSGEYALGSDGSVLTSTTTYSSRIQSTTSLDVFLTSHAIAEPTTIFRAEGYGCLGALYLLRAAYRYLTLHQQAFVHTTVFLYSDSLGLLRRLAYGSPQSIKHHLRPDSDLIREILQVQDDIPVSIKRQHVRSHQFDDTPDLQDLPISVQINRMCDTSCTLAHTCPSCRPRPTRPFYPSTRAHLLIGSSPYSSKLPVPIRHALSDDLLQQYIMTKESWDKRVFDMVHWGSINTNLHRLKSDGRKAAVKTMHRLWATNETLSIRSRKSSHRHDHRCTRCLRLHEDFSHILQCPSNRSEIQTALSSLTDCFSRFKVTQLMRQCILHGINNWLTSTSTPFAFNDSHTDQIFQAIRLATSEQNAIGWDNFIRGRLTSTWIAAHDLYHASRRLPPALKGPYLATALTGAMWFFCRHMWIQRNLAVYGDTPASARDIQEKQINQRITVAYTTQADFSSNDQTILFHVSLPDRLQHSLSRKVSWYSLYQTCLNAPDTPTNHPARPSTSLHNFFRPFVQTFHQFHQARTDHASHSHTVISTRNNPS